jgi:hypothetical protein
MHVPTAASVLCALLSASCLPAQATWIVDALNRPGTNFIDLQSAVNQSAPGDVVVVRYVDPVVQQYLAPTISHALTLIGTGGQPGLIGNLQIQNLPAGQHVAIRDLQLAPFLGANPGLSCTLEARFNHGTVHIHNVDRISLPTSVSAQNQWRIESCDLVTLSYCSVDMVGATGTLAIKNSPLVTLHASVLQNFPGTLLPTLSVDNSELVLTDSAVLGSGASSSAAAIEVNNNALVRIAGPATSVFALTGSTAVRGPAPGSTVVVGNGAYVGPVAGVVLQQQSIAALAGRIDLANVVQLTMFGDSLGIGVFAVGAPLPAPGTLFGGPLWLDPLQSGVGELIVLNLSGRGTWQLPLPPMPHGFTAWLQGAALGVANSFRLTPPTVVFAP